MPLILCLLILIAALALCAALLPLALPLLILIGVVQVVLLYLLLWTALVRCRKGHPAWAVLERFRYAHRGLHDKARGIPENSLAAFRAAVSHGYGAELDVHLTRDGRLAVIHDDSLLRTAGADAKASQLTADELAQYRLEGTEERIPFLEEVLPLFEGKAPLIVELKVEGNAAALARATCDMLDQHRVDYCIESFHPAAVRWLKKNRPDVCRGQLSERFVQTHTGLGFWADFAMTHLLTGFLTVPDFIAYNLHHRRRWAIALARRVWGVREVSWTIRTPAELAACEGDGCLSIFEGFKP